MTGLKGYHPEMKEAKPDAQIEAQSGCSGNHHYLKSAVELKGRGVTFLGTLKATDLTPQAQSKVGWHEYKVTARAFKAICEQHGVACEMLLS